MSRSKRANWHAQVRSLGVGAWMEGWLADHGSLTAKLIAHASSFRVQRLHQRRAPCLGDEIAPLGLPRAVTVWEREVILRCDEEPVVFAHTVVPLSCTASDWPLFKGLGERSLGITLFNDQRVVRGRLHYARIHAAHPLHQRAARALPHLTLPAQLFARRSLFQRKAGVLLVTELFLPHLSALRLAPINPSGN